MFKEMEELMKGAKFTRKQIKKQMKRNRIETDEDGLPCPRCGNISIVREHIEITGKLLSQPFYYSKWFKCSNKHCKTDIFYDEIYRVYPEKETEDITINTTKGSEQELRLEAIKQQLKPPWE